MLDGVQRKAAGLLCRIVPKAIGYIAVAQLMQGDTYKRGDDAEENTQEIAEVPAVPYRA